MNNAFPKDLEIFPSRLFCHVRPNVDSVTNDGDSHHPEAYQNFHYSFFPKKPSPTMQGDQNHGLYCNKSSFNFSKSAFSMSNHCLKFSAGYIGSSTSFRMQSRTQSGLAGR